MKITTVTIRKHESTTLPQGRAYRADGLVVICNEEGLHYIAEDDLPLEQLKKLAPILANSIYFPEVCP